MDAEAVSAALSPQALAPPIAKTLGLDPEAVQTALMQLAAGDQPAFLAHYRPDKIKGLTERDLERIQAQAARAAGFEFKRQEVAVEMLKKRQTAEFLVAHLRTADHPMDLDDLRSTMRRRKRGPAAKARSAGLSPAAAALWVHGSHGVMAQLMADKTTAEAHALVEAEPAAAEPTADETSVHEASVHEAAPPSSQLDEASVGDEGAQAPVEAADVAAEAGSAEPETSAEPEAPGEPEPRFDVASLVAEIEAGRAPTDEAVLRGLCAICAEHMAEHPPLRRRLRALTMSAGKLSSAVVPEKKDKAARYSKYFDRAEPCKGAAASNVLALHRGEREGVLRVDLDVDPDKVVEAVVEELGIDRDHPAGAVLVRAATEAWTHALGKAVKGGVRKLLKERADRDAIGEFAEALRPLLLAPALGRKPLIAIDGGHQNGCRVVVLGAEGQVLAQETLYPLSPKQQVPQSKARLAELVKEHQVVGFAVGATPAGREVERICRALVKEHEDLGSLIVTSADADAAALYASSKLAREEFPDGDAALRRAVSVGRRVQDPLRELVKVDARKLGLGQYQHEVDQEELRSALEQVTTYCVSHVTADVNEDTADHLARVAGLSHALAKAIVAHRQTKGRFASRASLLDVPGLPGKAFEQASGFLRIVGGDQPLDATGIHPERYPLIMQMARELGVIVPDLFSNEELLAKVDKATLVGQPGVSGDPLGPIALDRILDELRRPRPDPRPPFEAVEFNPELGEFGDLKVGMELEGIVTHLAPFGAFVDVGLEHDGLVHVSELSHGFISNPLDAVHVGQKVKGRVIEVAPERKRFSLSLKALMPRPDRPPRKDGKGPGKGKRKDGKDGRGKPPRKDGKGKPERKERTLEFRMDLSSLASLLDKG